MEQTRLGASGLEITPLILGTMSFGEPARGSHPWTLTEEASRPLIRRAHEAGITAFDTADVYSDGTSEEIVGRVLKEIAPRDQLTILTKVHGRMRGGANGAGLSRAHILAAIDASLTRLGTDHVDVYQIHRWDPAVPIEETMEALHDVVRAGKARYIGASSMWAWQFAKAQHTARLGGWTRFISMQDQYNLLQREEEREMHPLCQDQGVGVIPWSPLARGQLTRAWGSRTVRSVGDAFGQTLYGGADASNSAIVAAVHAVAAARGVPPAQVALAWVAAQPAVSAPIVGVTKPHHVDDAVASLDIRLTSDELAALEAPYTPRPAEGF
ncbi:MAG: aldo/keto reductase [Bifidobacteriaceae bacterium]|jgi:aryl-alcohol dehydrogenase-like predicted oxidoreductase|nr:aldo/keto reductase [Bifidobacteriaceae bacterium]